eukprot:gene28951-32143_t
MNGSNVQMREAGISDCHACSIFCPARLGYLADLAVSPPELPQSDAADQKQTNKKPSNDYNSANQSNLMEIERIPAWSDNYIWLCHDNESQLTMVVDPTEDSGVNKMLEEKGWKLSHIFNTHHHNDHTDRIPGIDTAVGDGDTFKWGSQDVVVFDTPGHTKVLLTTCHTKGHIVFHVPTSQALFSGDTLFALGCGRLFEGTPQQMWTSLSKIIALPDETTVYCAHEYTQSNAKFAVTVDPGNDALLARKEHIDKLRSQGIPTIPSNLGEEKATNPFLRAGDAGVRTALGMQSETIPDWQVFGAIRKAKDNA